MELYLSMASKTIKDNKIEVWIETPSNVRAACCGTQRAGSISITSKSLSHKFPVIALKDARPLCVSPFRTRLRQVRRFFFIMRTRQVHHHFRREEEDGRPPTKRSAEKIATVT